MSSVSAVAPNSTRAPSTFIPSFILPECTFSMVYGGAVLMEATSKARCGWPGAVAASRNKPAIDIKPAFTIPSFCRTRRLVRIISRNPASFNIAFHWLTARAYNLLRRLFIRLGEETHEVHFGNCSGSGPVHRDHAICAKRTRHAPTHRKRHYCAERRPRVHAGGAARFRRP